MREVERMKGRWRERSERVRGVEREGEGERETERVRKMEGDTES